MLQPDPCGSLRGSDAQLRSKILQDGREYLLGSVILLF